MGVSHKTLKQWLYGESIWGNLVSQAIAKLAYNRVFHLHKW